MSDSVKSTQWKSFADFLANAPPSSEYTGTDVTVTGGGATCVATPPIDLFCTSDCQGMRHFDSKSVVVARDYTVFLYYSCRHCQRDSRHFALLLMPDGDSAWKNASVRKVGQDPPFGPPVPARVITLIGPDRDYFLKGHRCEAQGLGVGAFAYYRRVIESQKDRLLSEIIRVAQRTSATDVVESLEAAKRETQFTKAIDDVKPAVPESLKIDGHNPLTLLHGALSAGLHAGSDDECLHLATAIRVVLVELADRMGQALKDQQELKSAVSLLMNPRKPV